MTAPLPIMRYVVIAGQDTGRVGVAVDTLEMEELFGDWHDWLLEKLRIRPRRRWQAVWLVIQFEDDGSEGAFRRDELEVRHV
jgi:hypothetical protein